MLWKGKRYDYPVISEEIDEVELVTEGVITMNPKLPIGFNVKMQLVDELAKCLEQMNKRIKVSYF